MTTAFRRLPWVVFLTLALSACESTPTTPTANGDPCALIDQLMASADDGVRAIREGAGGNRNIRVYATSLQAVGNNCQVWEWAAGRTNYVCVVVQPEVEQAELLAKSAIARAKACPGWQWTESTRNVTTARAGGSSVEVTTLSTTKSRNVLSVAILENDGLFGRDASIYYAVGSPLEAP